jgi:hypothetical protein
MSSRCPPIGPFALTVGLLLTACSTPVVLRQHADVQTRMRTIAARFLNDQQQGGMAGVIADIEACYAGATHPVIDVYTLRDCLILDYVAYHNDHTVGLAFGAGPLPYFTDATAIQRWKNYGLVADYRTPTELAGYLRDASQLVQIDIAQIKG